ncbi:MAG: hypothetical protein M1812_006774 [Candelaria pacifica]|nr:MAG: hypothetical protein M1812_006774 [Candelaria pacifica]
MAQSPPSALLLLPAPPWPPSFASLNAAYGRALSSVFLQVAKLPNESSTAAILQVAVPCAHLCKHGLSPRHRIYAETQKLLAALYSLMSVVCTREPISIEDQGGVNSMVLLLAYDGSLTRVEDQHASVENTPQGPFVTMKSLAACCRPWTHFFTLATEEGEKMAKEYVSLRHAVSRQEQPHINFIKVTEVDENQNFSQDNGNDPQPEQGTRKHADVAVGGTFDHLHAGHKLLLTMSALVVEPFRSDADSLDRSITVGITGDELLKNKKFAEYLESWEDRQMYVSDFLKAILDFSPPGKQQPEVKHISEPGPNGKVIYTLLKPGLTIKCVEISDPFGPTITDKSISALVVSTESRSGGKAVNSKRHDKGWPSLEVYEVDVLDAGDELKRQSSAFTNVQESFESKISSTAIRQQKSEKAHSTLGK